MATKNPIRIGAAAAIIIAASLLAINVQQAPAQSPGRCDDPSTMSTISPTELRVTQMPGASAEVPAAYDWPLKPFDQQHPVRGFFDDPRIGAHGSHAFHFGIDISAPDGTPVYAVRGGEVFFDSGQAIAVVVGPEHEFGYWHVVPAVTSHQHVSAHQLLGWIAAGWGHVHFAERIDGVYVNPLRPGGIGPYSDTSAPSVAGVSIQDGGNGTLTFVADAYDMPSPAVPGDWAGLPVTPVLIRWRLFRIGAPTPTWNVAADFRERMLDAALYPSVYAPETAQNHQGRAGRYCFYLGRGLSLDDGAYEIEVQALDTRDNRADGRLDFQIAAGAVAA
jgi:Peptidase family M23